MEEIEGKPGDRPEAIADRLPGVGGAGGEVQLSASSSDPSPILPDLCRTQYARWVHQEKKQKMKLKMKYWPLLASIAWAGQAMATDLGTISVTAQRSEAPIGESSKSVTVIDRQTIEASHAQNVVDLFKGIPNAVVRDTSGIGAKSQVDLGGFGESAGANSVVMIDGRRINSPDLSGVDWTQIPLDQIERIEIVHGNGSVLYGQGAVGGVINIITRVPATGGKISIEAGSFGTTAGRLHAGAATGKLRVEANASGLKTDGYRKNGQFERYDGGLRAEIDLPADSMLYFSGNHHIDRAGLPGSLTQAELQFDRRQTNTPTDYSRATDDFITAGLQTAIGAANIDAPVTYRRRDTKASYFGFLYPGTLRSLSFRPKLDGDQVFGGVNAHWTAGVDLDRTDGTFSGIKAKRTSDGYYGYVRLADTDGRFGLSGGYRSEGLKDQLTQSVGNDVTNRKDVYEIGLTAAAGGFQLAVNHSTSVRMPLLDERFDWWTSSWNPLLKVQTGNHFGVSARYGSDQGFAEFSFSRADMKNEIFFNPMTFANENYTDKTRHDVWMVQEEWQLTEQARLSANYTYTVARFRGGAFNGKDIPAVPKHKFGARLNADFQNGFGLMLNVGWVGSSWLISDQANVMTKLGSYLVMDAACTYRWQDVELFARVENLSNRKYSSYGVSGFAGAVYYPAPTLAARAGVSYSF